jgi:CheY-like chemotaxis protein
MDPVPFDSRERLTLADQAGDEPDPLALPLHTSDRSTRAFKLPLRVLIADDYVDAAESLALVLSIKGVTTHVEVDGADALAFANSWRPHICVLDIGMPKIDGYEIARRIREQKWVERPLLIALTGWTTEHNRRSAFEVGFDHYMTKPADPMTLVRILQSFLDRARVLRR